MAFPIETAGTQGRLRHSPLRTGVNALMLFVGFARR
jgi:hypothetical protein